MKYAAYNVLYHKGKKVTRTPFRAAVGKTRSGVKKEVMQYNARWNRQKMNKHYKAKLYKIKKVSR